MGGCVSGFGDRQYHKCLRYQRRVVDYRNWDGLAETVGGSRTCYGDRRGCALASARVEYYP